MMVMMVMMMVMMIMMIMIMIMMMMVTTGVRKRRIYDVMNVLESVEIVQRQGKNAYVWLGTHEVEGALNRLKVSRKWLWHKKKM